jgi:hypothetical protein
MQESSPHSPSPESLWRVEAARYALLRRLAQAMRHHMVVNLQPIGMITEVMDRRLQAGAPDLAQVQQSMGRINGFSKAAVQSCLDVVSWLSPDAEATVALGAGVAECMSLVRSQLSFRGIGVREDIAGAEVHVLRSALRSTLPAALLALTDAAVSPATLVLATQASADGVSVSLAIEAAEGTPGFPADTPYRVLGWDEVRALGEADGVQVERLADDQVLLRLRPAGA